MGGIEIRRLAEEHWPAVLDISRVTFGEEYVDEDLGPFRVAFPMERAFGAFDRGRLVGCTAALSMQLTLPGHTSIPMGGLTWVGVLPTHRRRGILTGLLRAQSADMVEHGEAVSGLVASEGNIYGRFGYGPAVSAVSFSVERAHGAFFDPVGPERTGRITLLAAEEAGTRLPPIYEALLLQHPGMVSRPGDWWSGYLADPPHHRRGQTRMFHVIHESADGTPDGYASYRLKDDWSDETAALKLTVVDLVAADRQVYKELWDYLLRTDLTSTISCWRGRLDEPLRWLLADPRRFHVTSMWDSLWVRLLDMPRALTARAYRSTGRLVFEVHDPFPEPAARNLGLEVTQAGVAGLSAVHCAPVQTPPDLSLDAGSLGAAYLGGASFASLAAAGRVQQRTRGAVETADTMFSTGTAPFCSTEF
jgi:predicted acetyltransferase